MDMELVEPLRYLYKEEVRDILKEVSGKDKIEVKKFVRFKAGEGI